LIPKPKRVKNRKLLEEVRRYPCGVLGCKNKAQAAHLRHGNGHDDTPENLAPLCWYHHTGEQHIIGWLKFKMLHPEVMTLKELRERKQDPFLWGEFLKGLIKTLEAK
jgi:hypothetical protein